MFAKLSAECCVQLYYLVDDAMAAWATSLLPANDSLYFGRNIIRVRCPVLSVCQSYTRTGYAERSELHKHVWSKS